MAGTHQQKKLRRCHENPEIEIPSSQPCSSPSSVETKEEKKKSGMYFIKNTSTFNQALSLKNELENISYPAPVAVMAVHTVDAAVSQMQSENLSELIRIFGAEYKVHYGKENVQTYTNPGFVPDSSLSQKSQLADRVKSAQTEDPVPSSPFPRFGNILRKNKFAIPVFVGLGIVGAVLFVIYHKHILESDDGSIFEKDVLERLSSILPKVISNLRDVGELNSFVQFNELLASGSFPFENIAYRLFCDVVQWYTLSNTSSMRYSELVKRFWRTGYKLFKGKFLRFMSGLKNTGNINEGMSERGKYEPMNSENHPFDKPERSKLTGTRRRVKSCISDPSMPARGIRPIRQFHRLDESKILPHVRKGLEFNDESEDI
ncbi:unnamed protein product [Mytilus edulis]|uniref:Uncharacterized protein n=1 Tax=Mytilus edulis TaxID=6550 RepID=A0A8S3SJW6_MYTED|nr:unnamed protein product [Mytilus edulis]